MKTITITLICATLCGPVYAADPDTGQGFIIGDKFTPNAYGLGVHSDSTGKAFTWQPDNGPTLAPIFQDQVKPDAYGPGIGSDSFGRPVKRKSQP
jgi:hypothetical protein